MTRDRSEVPTKLLQYRQRASATGRTRTDAVRDEAVNASVDADHRKHDHSPPDALGDAASPLADHLKCAAHVAGAIRLECPASTTMSVATRHSGKAGVMCLPEGG